MEDCFRLLEYINNESNFTVVEEGEELFDYHKYFDNCRQFIDAVTLTDFNPPSNKYFHNICQNMNSANSYMVYSNMPGTSGHMKEKYISAFWEQVEKVEGAIKEIKKGLEQLY